MLLQRDDKGALAARPSVPASYRQLLVQYRQSQLQLTAQNIKRLEGVFDGAVRDIQAQVRKGASGDAQEQFLNATGYYQRLLANLEGVLQALRSDYAHLLTVGMADLAQNAANREAEVARLAGFDADAGLMANIEQTFTLSDGSDIAVSFGQIALRAVERCASRVYSDGWQLSDRLYNLDAAMRRTIQDTLVQGVTEQISAHQLSLRLRDNLAAAGSANPRYDAMRIARTEIVTAHREAHILSTIDPGTGRLREWIQAIGWRLSLSHPRTDICDVWAEDDGDGLGEGNYLPDNVPSDHPHGLCYTTTVLAEYPDVSAPSKAPDTADLSESQAEYYVDKYDDPAARRWLEKRQ